MSDPLASVVIITYNHEYWISDCLTSVFEQKTEYSYEIVIGEDKSTDRTRGIIDDIIKKQSGKIILITSNKNVGTIKNVKRAIDACQGKYIFFLSGDDYWHNPLKMEKQIKFLEANLEYGMVHSNCELVYQNDWTVFRPKKKNINTVIPDGYIFEDLLEKNFIMPSTVCVRHELLKLYDDYDLYEREGFIAADLPRWLKISRHCKIGYSEESLATYRVLKNSLSRPTDQNERYNYLSSIYDIQNYFISKYGCSDTIESRIRYAYYKRLLIHSLITLDQDRASYALEKMQFYNNLQGYELVKYRIYYWASGNKIASLILRRFIVL